MPDSLIVETVDQVVSLTINRPTRRNALDDATLFALRGALADSVGSGVAAIVLRGEGTVSFCAGSDIKELAGQSLEERVAHTALGQDVAEAIERHPAPVIAAIEGYCLGGGLEIALACDLRIVGAGSQLGLPEVQINGLPSWGGTFRLAPVVGVGRAKEITLFGRRLDAQEAIQWGLAAEAVAEGGAYDRALEVARSLVEGTDRETFARAKALVDAKADPRVGRQLELLADRAQLASSAFEETFSSFGG